MTQNNSNTAFAENLRYLCNTHKSISQVASQLSISRSQFNRYLSGKHMPSANMLHRLCEFFNVQQDLFLLGHAAFIDALQPSITVPRNDLAVAQFAQILSKKHSGLSFYCGNYYLYHQPYNFPGSYAKSMLTLSKTESGYRYTRLYIVQKGSGFEAIKIRSHGVAQMIGPHIHLVDVEKHQTALLTHFTLFTDPLHIQPYLKGIGLTCAARGDQMPYAYRFVLEKSAQSVSLLTMARTCGLYPLSNPDLSDAIRAHTNNAMSNDDNVFTARQQTNWM